MLGVLRRYTQLRKTTQPGIQACPMRACRVLQYREPATCAPDTRHPDQDWFPPPINSKSLLTADIKNWFICFRHIVLTSLVTDEEIKEQTGRDTMPPPASLAISAL